MLQERAAGTTVSISKPSNLKPKFQHSACMRKILPSISGYNTNIMGIWEAKVKIM